jgi:hypothetical protein
MMNVTATVFTGKLKGSDVSFELARQIGWLLILTLIARGGAYIAARRVVIQGG